MGDPRVGAGAGVVASGTLGLEMPQLSFGAKGPEVERIQQQLNQAGYPLQVDGDWGPKTEAAVRDFQKAHGLAADGVVGPKTSHALGGQGIAASKPAAAERTTDLQQQLSTVDSPLSIAIGHAEGNRTATGAKTESYAGHRDPVNGQRNAGNFSLQHPSASPAEADQLQLAQLRGALPAYQKACDKAGLDSTNPLLAATFFDLYNQSPQAATAKGGFLDQLTKVKQAGVTPESLTKARLEAWRDPGSGKLDHKFDSDQALVADQRRRMDCLAEVTGAGPSAPGEKVGLGSTGPEVKELKQALKDAGFYQGPINDKMGQQGIDALNLAKTTLGIAGPADLAGPETLRQIRDFAADGAASNVPFISQFDPQVPGDYPGQGASLKCDNACELMMAKAGTRAGASNAMVTEFHGGGQAEPAVQYLEQQLKAGHPVMLGVRHPQGSSGASNLNGINHYVVATGVGIDSGGRKYIKFHDPAQTSAALGADTNAVNRLYLSNGSFRQDATGPHGHDPYELRGVVRNAG